MARTALITRAEHEASPDSQGDLQGNLMRRWDAGDWITLGLCLAGAIVVAAIVFMAVDFIGGTAHQEEVGVVDKHYEPSHYTTGTDSKGKLVTQYESEQYILIIARDGQTKSRAVSAQEYTRAQPGQTATLGFRRGWLTGKDW
jgi:hypothetical protein